MTNIENPFANLRVLLAGATGLVGGHCLQALLANPQVGQVIAPTRRALRSQDPKLQNPQPVFDKLAEHPELFAVDAIICCLGTTQKQAGSKKAFHQVDYQYCYDLARLGRDAGVPAFYVVSAMGASTQSLSFYSRVKGKLEQALKRLDYPLLSIYRPSLLLGEREALRVGEFVGTKVAPAINSLLRLNCLRPFKAIDAGAVGRALASEAIRQHYTGMGSSQEAPQSALVLLHTHDDIIKLASGQSV